MFGITVRFVRFLRNVALCVAMAVMTMPALAAPMFGIQYVNPCDNNATVSDSCIGDQCQNYELPKTTFTCGTKVFTGWNTASDGSGTTYSPSTSINLFELSDGISDVTLYAQWLSVSPMVNVKYIHQAIAAKWGVNIAYHPNLKNERAAANMRYLMGMIDVANKRLGGTDKRYGDSIYATSYAASKNTVDKAVATLIKPKPKTFPFTATTTSSTSSFSFSISAAGTFYVDWGDGTAVETITKTDTNNQTISHTYTKEKVYDIKIGGLATEYSTSSSIAAISFGSNTNLAGISGSLGAIFPTLADGSQPIFYATFSSCTNLTGSIPENLFAGIRGAPASNMFGQTFSGCTGLTGSIPENLFAGIQGAPASYMFSSTFFGCTGLTGEIPLGLFGDLSGSPANYMFNGTFSGCKGLTGEIPLGLFGDLSGSPANHMFNGTFYNCKRLIGKSARNPDGTYLYDVFPSATSSQVSSMYSGTCLEDNANIPSVWGGGVACTYGDPEPDYLFTAKHFVAGMDTYTFDISAAGTFYVNVEGKLQQKIVKTDTTKQTVTIHFSDDSGTYEFKIGGQATAYSTTEPAIKFEGSIGWGLSSISGSLGSVFPTLADGSQPLFTGTFSECKMLSGEIPAELFDGVHGAPVDNMFSNTFAGCDRLTGEIPADLFGEIQGAPAKNMFNNTFGGCAGLTGIGGALFAGISGAPAEGMYSNTFDYCTGLTGNIPSGLFGSLSGASANYMFGDTFMGCSGLTGPSARNPDGTYLYNVFPTATSSQVGRMYYGTCLYDNASIPSAWGGAACTYTGPIPADEVTDY